MRLKWWKMTEKCFCYDSPVGRMALFCKDDFLTGVRFDFAKRYENTCTEDVPAVIYDAVRWLDDYFSGKASDKLPKMRICGTEFQKLVWGVLATVPYGTVVTYGYVAGVVADIKGIAKMSARAVGTACGKNPFAVMIPCHRVIASGNMIGGYGFEGVLLKRKLLRAEGIDDKSLKDRV